MLLVKVQFYECDRLLVYCCAAVYAKDLTLISVFYRQILGCLHQRLSPGQTTFLTHILDFS